MSIATGHIGRIERNRTRPQQNKNLFGEAGDLATRKKTLLHKLRSAGRYKYRRYGGLPLRYAGGKSLAVGYVVENLPHDMDTLVSPFFGGGSVEIACAKELGLQVRGYDVFDILVNYWRVQTDSPAALARKLSQFTPDKETYQKVKEILKAHWNGDEIIDDALELAARYWFNHNLSYGPGFLGWISKIYEEPERVSRLIKKVADFDCPGLTVSRVSFEDVIPRHRGDFLYCDPPYYLEGDSRMFRGIYPQRNFPVHHKNFDHEKLRDLLLAHTGGFILSYNDCGPIRDWYSGCRILEVKWQYTLGQGETRIGKNRIENGSRHYVKQSHELLIIRDR